MSSICFETESSSSGRRLNIQLWYGTLYVSLYNYTYKSGHKQRLYKSSVIDAVNFKFKYRLDSINQQNAPFLN
jgi:hypothetical protein